MEDRFVCPACGDKFPNAKSPERCKKCGLPNEVRERGSEAITAWQQQMAELRRQFGRHHARVAHEEQGKGKKGLAARKARNKHGRRGVKHAAR